MDKFTPGPWDLRLNGIFLRIVHGQHKTTVADGIVSEANANLLRAAPELLEALQEIVTRGPTSWAAKIAAEAIAKATGGPSPRSADEV